MKIDNEQDMQILLDQLESRIKRANEIYRDPWSKWESSQTDNKYDKYDLWLGLMALIMCPVLIFLGFILGEIFTCVG